MTLFFVLVVIFIKTRCSRCKKLIDFKEKYCSECEKKVRKTYKNQAKDKYVESTTSNSQWKAVRRQVLLRDKCCLYCLKTRNFIETRGLQVHHIVKRVDDYSKIYDVSNLVTLCRVCHEEIEKMPVKKQKEIFSGYIDKDISFSIL